MGENMNIVKGGLGVLLGLFLALFVITPIVVILFLRVGIDYLGGFLSLVAVVVLPVYFAYLFTRKRDAGGTRLPDREP